MKALRPGDLGWFDPSWMEPNTPGQERAVRWHLFRQTHPKCKAVWLWQIRVRNRIAHIYHRSVRLLRRLKRKCSWN